MTIGSAAAVTVARQESGAPARIFQFDADGFWLNLHHFLYVLGRADAAMRDAARASVASAPADEKRGLPSLSDGERQAWHEAVRAYARTVSPKDILFDRELVPITAALARLESPTVPSEGVLAPVAVHLNAAAPAYRKAWWPAHRGANERWVGATEALLDRYGKAVRAFLTRAYGQPWPDAGFLIHVSGYTNWAGAYSVTRGLIVVASLPEGNAGAHGLEAAFHESLHQWDQHVLRMLDREAAAVGVAIPDWLDHALLFYAAGAAVRSVVPDYTPIAEVAGIWQRSGRPFKSALDEVWAPYLRGQGTREEALREILRRTGARRQPGATP